MLSREEELPDTRFEDVPSLFVRVLLGRVYVFVRREVDEVPSTRVVVFCLSDEFSLVPTTRRLEEVVVLFELPLLTVDELLREVEPTVLPEAEGRVAEEPMLPAGRLLL